MKAKHTIGKYLLRCDDCNYEFLLNADHINEAKVMINDQQFTLVYFTCPKCNKIYRIILKDKRYEELAEDLERTKNRIRKNHGSNNIEFARVLDDMVRKKHERLKNHSDRLNQKFSGTFTFVVSQNNQKDKFIKYLP